MVSILGDVRFAQPADIFTASSAGLASSNEVIAKSLDREAKRLQGFKVDLTPAENKRLETLQLQITRIEARAGPDGLSISQFNDRAELFREANEILGKEYVDVSADPVLEDLVAKVDALLEPELRGDRKKRLENLRKLEENMLSRYGEGNTSRSLAQQLGNVQLQIKSLTPPRKIAELTPVERRDYDKLVEQINTRAGTDYLLDSKTREKAEKIQATIASL